jgi:hypothetical protein
MVKNTCGTTAGKKPSAAPLAGRKTSRLLIFLFGNLQNLKKIIR